jgi:DNA-binding IclR family transcriptional regulator
MKRCVSICIAVTINHPKNKTKKNLRRKLKMKRNIGQSGQYRTSAWAEPEPNDNLEPEHADASDDVRRLRPLTVLEHLSEASQPLTLAQLSSLMRVPKSTLMRLLRSMELHGYVMHMPAERGFVSGVRSTTLALRTLRGANIRRECRAVLRGLVRKLGETCNLTAPDAGRVLYVERIDTTAPLRMHLQPGTWVPMHCTASGKLFLASMSLLERRNILTHLPLTRSSPHTIIDRQELEIELQKIGKRDVGIDNEEFVCGMVAVAVPVRGRDNKLVAAIACHAPTARMSLDELLAGVPDLRVAAEEMRQVLFPASA